MELNTLNFRPFHLDTNEFKGPVSTKSTLEKVVNVLGKDTFLNLKSNIAECDEIIMFGDYPESQSTGLTLKRFLGIH